MLVDVIFETIERICEQTTPSSSWNSMPSPPLEIADYFCVREFGKLNMLGEAPKLLEDSFVTAANLEGHW